MIKKSLLTTLIFLLFSYTPAHAQTFTSYIWQYPRPQNISGADDLKTKLETETQKVINAGHLAPFRTLYGEGITRFDWVNRYDSIYTISLAYPYLNSTLQTQAKNYLKNELTSYPVWIDNYGGRYLDPNVGTKREPDILPTGVRVTNQEWDYRFRPKLFALYALWLYAHNTGDWVYIEQNWSAIKDWYSANTTSTTDHLGEVGQYYTSISGAIGIARMAMEKPTPDAATRDIAVAHINSGLTNGKNFLQFATLAENIFLFNGGNNQIKTEADNPLAYYILDVSPEIGRYFNDDPNLKSAILGSDPAATSFNYSLASGEYKSSLWFMAQAPYAMTEYYGEGSGQDPLFKGMMFPIHIWVKKDNAQTLRKYLDVPDALIGDFYHIQNLTRTIEASGTECWEDMTTTTQECPTPLFSAASPTPSPLASPSPSPVKPGDIDGNGKVDIFDYNILLTNFGKTGTGIQGDIDNSGKVDIFDYNILLTNFGK